MAIFLPIWDLAEISKGATFHIVIFFQFLESGSKVRQPVQKISPLAQREYQFTARM